MFISSLLLEKANFDLLTTFVHQQTKADNLDAISKLFIKLFELGVQKRYSAPVGLALQILDLSNVMKLPTSFCCQCLNLYLETCFAVYSNLDHAHNELLESIEIILERRMHKRLISILQEMESQELVRPRTLTKHRKELSKSLQKFLQLAQNIEQTKVSKIEFLSAMIKMISFLKKLKHKYLIQKYSKRLIEIYDSEKNHVECAFLLRQIAELFTWKSINPVEFSIFGSGDVVAEKDYRARLYFEAVKHLCIEQYWERALLLLSDLHQFYQEECNYLILSQIFTMSSNISLRMSGKDRVFQYYYHVAFYGSDFPVSLAGKRFVFRGCQFEGIGEFCDRILGSFKDSKLIKSSAMVDTQIALGKQKHIQIFNLQPIQIGQEAHGLLDLKWNLDVKNRNMHDIDLEANRWIQKADLSNLQIQDSAYLQNNETRAFTYTRPLRKGTELENGFLKDIIEVHLEKALILIEDTLPCESAFLPIKQIVAIEFSPIEIAISNVLKKTEELKSLEQMHKKSHEPPRAVEVINSLLEIPNVNQKQDVNSSALTLSLKGAIESPVNGGIAVYREAFMRNPELAGIGGCTAVLCETLKSAILNQVRQIASCLELHKSVIKQDLWPLHNQLVGEFERSYSQELHQLEYVSDMSLLISARDSNATLSSFTVQDTQRSSQGDKQPRWSGLDILAKRQSF
jgi:dedicator of cytokinesis protein 3